MTPQEQDLITSLLSRLQQAGNQPKDPEAAELIRRGMSTLPDAPYLLVQTVLIQDMALSEAHNRIKELEQKAAAPPAQPASFLAGARANVPPAGPWGQAAPPSAPSGPVWTQAAPQAPAATMAPLAAPSATSSFLRQAATTAAGIAGGALLFQGIQSMFGAHYGSGFLSNTAMQPGLGETVINNYYGSDTGDTRQADYDPGASNDPNLVQADNTDYSDPGQDFADNQDFGSDSSDV